MWRSRDRACSLSSGVRAATPSLKIELALERYTHLRFCVGVHGCGTRSFIDLLRYNPTQQGSFKISPFFNSAGRQFPFPIVQYVQVTSQSFKSYYGEEENQREELKYMVCLLVWLIDDNWLTDWLIDWLVVLGMEPRAFVIHTICFTFNVRFKHTPFLSPERQGRGPECCSTFSAAEGGSRSSVLSSRLSDSARLFCPGLNLFPITGKVFTPRLTDPTNKWHPLHNWVWPHKTKCPKKRAGNKVSR